jgi:hypothetical protein
LFSFLSAVFLWGLPLAAVPVIIHLLNRRRRQVVGWGAMRFLLEVSSRRRRIWRWDDWLLMLLRSAAVVAMVLALTRPLMRSNWFGSAGGRDVIIVLDTSLSTARTLNGGQAGSVFEAMLQRVVDALGQLGESDDVRILLASTVPYWLMPDPMSVTPEHLTALKSRVRELRPTQASIDLPRCVLEAARAEVGAAGSRRVITVLTDGQAYGWRMGAGQAWQAVAEALRASTPPAVLNVVTVESGLETVTNLSVESLAAVRTIVAPHERVELTALVRNTGAWPTEPASVSWSAGDQSLGVTALAGLKPGESTTVSLAWAFDSPGVRPVTCRIDRSDDLASDSSDSLIVEVVEQVPVLVIDGDPQADAIRTETGYLLAALGRRDEEQAWRSVFTPKVVDLAGAAGERLENYHAIVCAGVGTLPDEWLSRLASFVQRGGGLWWVLGERTDRTFFNDKLVAQGKGLCPLALDEPIGEAEDHEKYAMVHPPAADHPATRLLADTQRLDADRGRLFRRHRFQITPAASKVPVLLKTDAGEPIMIENRLGEGRVFVQAVPLNVAWSNLPLCQAFVVLVHEWLWYLTEPAFTCWNLDPGQTFSAGLPIEPSSPPASAEIATPLSDRLAIPVVAGGNRATCRFSETLLPGDYTLALADAQGDQRTYPFHVRRDVRESDLTPLGITDRRVLAQAGGVRFVVDPLADTPLGTRTPKIEPIWSWLLVAILVFMLVELLLAGRLTRRRWIVAAAANMGQTRLTKPTPAGPALRRERILAG